MSEYNVLALKYRPKSFSQVSGQKHILNSIINSLKDKRIHHSYLFTGMRGIGKTSVARILAKSLNCQIEVSPYPCEKCTNCVGINEGTFVDLIEIDGASRTKVEDMREMLENIQYTPSQGRFKIYLIDEVHMLSKHSFNALLKTLEEPPKHVKFILATTEIHKIPDTVISRCIHFSLKKLSGISIEKKVTEILKNENIQYDDVSINLIQEYSHGSMRDALNLVDQCVENLKLSHKRIKEVLGITKKRTAFNLIKYILKQNLTKIVQLNEDLMRDNECPYMILNEIAEYLSSTKVYKLTEIVHDLRFSKKELMFLNCHLSNNDIDYIYEHIIKSKEIINLAPNYECGLNMTFLNICNHLRNNQAKNENDNQKVNKIVDPKNRSDLYDLGFKNHD